MHFNSNAWLLAFCCAVSTFRAVESYESKYDSVNLDDIFKSKRLVNNYLNCLKKMGPCTPEGQELRDKLPDALESDCAHCSKKQWEGASKVLHFVVENKPEDFEILESLYDPSGEFRRKHLDDQMNFISQMEPTEPAVPAASDETEAPVEQSKEE